MAVGPEREKAVGEIRQQFAFRTEVLPLLIPRCGDADPAVRRAAMETLDKHLGNRRALCDAPAARVTSMADAIDA